MAPISLKKSLIDTYAKELLSLILNIDKNEENYKVAFEYVMSNLRFHRFLDVNPLDVSRNLSGLCSKFRVNSQDKKANHLEQLVEKFVNQPLIESRDAEKETQMDAHYAMLSLLLNLSNKPLSTVVKPPKQTVQQIEEEKFDWKRFLLEGEEKPVMGLDISDETQTALNNSSDELWAFSDEEEVEEEDDHTYVDLLEVRKQMKEDDRSHTQLVKEKAWLKKNLTPMIYWDENTNDGQQQQLQSLYYSNRYQSMCNNWELYMRIENKVRSGRNFQLLKEVQLVKETLWMLQDVENLYVYKFQDGVYTPNEDIVVSHMTKETLASYLASFTQTGNRVSELNRFAASAAQHEMSKTYSAFAYVIGMFLKRRNRKISDLEKTLIEEKETVTLATLKGKLTKDNQDISCIYKLYKDTVVKGSTQFSTVTQRVVSFLNIFFEVLLSFDALGDACVENVSIILTMFLDACQPYLHNLDEWLTIGKLPYKSDQEFMVYKANEQDTNGTNYWTSTYLIKQNKQNTNLVPSFLEPVSKQILLTGKSVVLLSEFPNFSKKIPVSTQTLHEEFKENLLQKFKEANDRFLQGTDTVDSIPLETSLNAVSEATSDPLVRSNFRTVFGETFERVLAEKKNGAHKNNSNINDDPQEIWKELLLNGACRPPIKMSIEQSIYPVILKRYDEVCAALLDLFKKDFDLLQYFRVMENFFLMKDGGTMHQFYSEVFQKAKEGGLWQDRSYLNIVLQDALQEQHPQLIGLLSVELQHTEINMQKANIFDGMYLHYKTPWPISIIFDGETETKYNEIFSFLLKVKRNIWTLEQLRFPDLTYGVQASRYSDSDSEGSSKYRKDDKILSEAKQKLKTRMLITRMKMLHVSRNFHFYLVTRIQNTACAEFDAKLKEAKDLDEVLQKHKEFLYSLKQRCLLKEKIARSRDALLRILSLAYDLESLWMSGLDDLDVVKLQSIEKDFGKCTAFLQFFFSSLAKRGSYPHFEFLAQTLKTDTHQSIFRR